MSAADASSVAPVGGAAFRAAMARLAAGVSVITSGRGGERTGLTATAVVSLSADPPTLLACVNRRASICPVLRRNGTFGVNILADTHKETAERFAGRHGVSGEARYEGASWTTLATGAPLLADALAALDCVLEDVIERHSHLVIIGKVAAVRTAGDRRPLIYWRGGYALDGAAPRA